MANAPIKRIEVGSGIKASIWENKSKNNDSWFSVKITRTYRDGEEWKETATFRLTDLLFVAAAAYMAFTWCVRKRANLGADTVNHE